jgi:MFS family permease
LSEPPGSAYSSQGLIRNVYGPSLLHAAGYGMLAPAIPLFATQLDVSVGLIGALVALQGLGQMSADIPVGLLVGRIGGRAAMALGVACAALAGVVLGFSTSSAQLFFAVPLVGVAVATWATARLAYVADVAPTDQRGRALSLVGGASRIGMTAGPIAGGFLSEWFGIQAAFFGYSVMCCASLAMIATSRSASGDRPPASTDAAHTRLLRTLSDSRRAFATAGTVAVCLVMMRNARRVLMPLWGVALGLDLSEIGLVIGISSAVDMTLFYPVGIVMDRWGRKWTIVPCMLLLALSLALVPFTDGFASFLLAGLLGGFANGLGSGAIMTMGSDLAPREHAGEFLGVWRLITDSGAVFSPVVVGGLAQALTLGAAFYGAGAFGLLGAGVLLLAVRDGLHTSRGKA